MSAAICTDMLGHSFDIAEQIVGLHTRSNNTLADEVSFLLLLIAFVSFAVSAPMMVPKIGTLVCNSSIWCWSRAWMTLPLHERSVRRSGSGCLGHPIQLYG